VTRSRVYIYMTPLFHTRAARRPDPCTHALRLPAPRSSTHPSERVRFSCVRDAHVRGPVGLAASAWFSFPMHALVESLNIMEPLAIYGDPGSLGGFRGLEDPYTSATAGIRRFQCFLRNNTFQCWCEVEGLM